MVALERELREPSPPTASTITADAIPLALRRRGASARQVLALTFLGVLTLSLFASRDLPSWVGGLVAFLVVVSGFGPDWTRY